MTEQKSHQIDDQLVKSAVLLLNEMVTLIYPDPHPDVFTLDDFQTRYRLTGFSETAAQALEKSQRINRQQRDYARIGLCEFHIGLIYFDTLDCRGAEHQFNQAHHQWSFLGDPFGAGLSYLAIGLSQHLSWQYEAAMANYSQVEKWLSRIKLALVTAEQHQFHQKLTDALQTWQLRLRKRIWQAPPLRPASSPGTPATPAASHRAAAAAPVIEEPPTPMDPVSPQPTGDSGQITAPPLIQIDNIIPGHKVSDPNLEWYAIEKRPPVNLFPTDVQEGGWLLVNKGDRAELPGGELVVVIISPGESLPIEGIMLRPVAGHRPYPHLCLAWLEEDETGFRNETKSGEVNLTYSPSWRHIPVKLEKIIGVVIGFWFPVQIK